MSDDTPDLSHITSDTFKAPEPHPLLASLPPQLKDPKNYEKIVRAIYDAGAGACARHAEIGEWAACQRCQEAAWNRKEFIYRLGFTSADQYMAWQKTHQYIRQRVPIEKYND